MLIIIVVSLHDWPIISKLFEVLLSMCLKKLTRYHLVLKVGTVDALFALTATVKHFTDRDSSVYLSSLDIRKAFDRVNHYKMNISLLEVGVPVIIVDVLCNWYSKLYYAVRWNSQISAFLQWIVASGKVVVFLLLYSMCL